MRSSSFSGSNLDLVSIASVLVLYCIAIPGAQYCIGIVLLAKRPILFILGRVDLIECKQTLIRCALAPSLVIWLIKTYPALSLSQLATNLKGLDMNSLCDMYCKVTIQTQD